MRLNINNPNFTNNFLHLLRPFRAGLLPAFLKPEHSLTSGVAANHKPLDPSKMSPFLLVLRPDLKNNVVCALMNEQAFFCFGRLYIPDAVPVVRTKHV